MWYIPGNTVYIAIKVSTPLIKHSDFIIRAALWPRFKDLRVNAQALKSFAASSYAKEFSGVRMSPLVR